MRTPATLQPVSLLTRALTMRRAWVAVRGRLVLAFLCISLLLALPSDGYLGTARVTFTLNQAIGRLGFQLASWEVQALSQKAHDLIARPGANLRPAQRHDLVAAYFDAIGRVEELNRQIERIYANPHQSDPQAAAAPLQAELDLLRAEQARRRPAVESILAEQVTDILREVGLTTAGRVWPPVSFQFSASPYYLIVSPRNRIVLQYGIYLEPELAVEQMEHIEEDVQRRLDVSALVEGTGGFSSYPTMIVENPDLEWVLSTIAHEWGHTYLAFRPLGWHYADSGDTRTLNETVVSILGDEIARRVLLRYYPELVPPADWPRPFSMRTDWWQRERPPRPFEFGPFMRQTRLHVDKLLAEGKVTEAEAYMEAQRQILLEQGYVIRKLNQAYFAFHGSYAVGPAATDPIGGKLRALRRRTESLAEFMQIVSGFTSAADLDAALARMR